MPHQAVRAVRERVSCFVLATGNMLLSRARRRSEKGNFSRLTNDEKSLNTVAEGVFTVSISAIYYPYTI